MKIINSKHELVNEYNALGSKFRKLSATYPKATDLLSHLSDEELRIYIAGETLRYGRDWQASLENAEHHLKNREQAIQNFGHKIVDLLGG